MATAEKKTAEKAEVKMVTVCLFKDDGDYKDDVYVGVNGEDWLIKRGEEVEVPEYVAEVLANSERQDRSAAKMMQELSSKYSE